MKSKIGFNFVKITKVKASYELLKDPELRRLFDAKIKNSYTLEDAWNEINRLKTAKCISIKLNATFIFTKIALILLRLA